MVFTRKTHLPKRDDDAKKTENEEKKMRASALRAEDMRREKSMKAITAAPALLSVTASNQANGFNKY